MFGLAGLLLLGVASQWLAWRLRLPSILLLLLVGFVAGPFTGQRLLDPDELLGESLLPFVSLSVAVVLFEGGLGLRLAELKGAGRATLQLILLGPPITFALSAWAAHLVLGLDRELSALLGAILVVTGPTVILPLLRHVRPAGSLGRVILWEGIVTDPIGAILAVLVFQTLALGGGVLAGAGLAVLGGGLAGLIGAVAIVLLLRYDLVPDFLQAATVLGIALAAYVAANLVQHESGLLAVTLMGILLANQKLVSIEHIVEFKENLRVLLLSTLFLLLAARLPLEEFTRFDLRGLAFLLFLIVVVRPVSVLGATLFTGLSWRERLFVGWMAPRGVVAAAVTSIFALELTAREHPGAERLVPIVFLVILGTVAVYGLTALPLARRLGLARPAPQGVLFVGAHDSARAMARALKEAGFEVLLVDTNHHDVRAARMQGLEALYANVLADDFLYSARLEGIGQVVAVTASDHFNALACLHLASLVGRAGVHQLAPAGGPGHGADMPRHLRGRVLFTRDATFSTLTERIAAGAIVKRTKLSAEFGLAEFRDRYRSGGGAVPLFVLEAGGRLRVVSARSEVQAQPGDTLVALVDEPVVEEPVAAEPVA